MVFRLRFPLGSTTGSWSSVKFSGGKPGRREHEVVGDVAEVVGLEVVFLWGIPVVGRRSGIIWIVDFVVGHRIIPGYAGRPLRRV